ncbi:PDZ domain-containing protein [bacterium]|nr:PDZ domain-containing protein [bacterium]
MNRIIIIAISILALIAGSQVIGAEGVYIGIYHEASTDPPGLLVSVVLDAPAYKSGLRTGDVILALDGVDLGDDPSAYAAMLEEALSGKSPGDELLCKVWRPGPFYRLFVNGEEIDAELPLDEFKDLLANAGPDDEIELLAFNYGRELEITVVLGTRPEGGEGMLPSNAELFPDWAKGLVGPRMMIDILIDETGTRAEYEDLLARLDQRATPDDGYRLPFVTYLLRDGLQGEVVVGDLTDEIASASLKGIDGFTDIHNVLCRLKDVKTRARDMEYTRGVSAEEHIAEIEKVLIDASEHVKAAFSRFKQDEIEFLRDHRAGITEIYREANYIHYDPDVKRFRNNLRVIELAKKIDYWELMKAQAILTSLADEEFLATLKDDLTAEYADRLDESVLFEKETPLGSIVILGAGQTWRNLPTDPDNYRHDLLVIDLGGDDFYSTTAGSGISPEYPIGVLIDFAGNDAYESTLYYSQGSGSMGCGLLIDMEGDDSYIGLQWAQGTGFLGCGALIDVAGNDNYRGHEFTQAAGIFGSGVLYDIEGNDTMEAHCKSQAFGGANAAALLVDCAGDDSRYSKGTYPTGYGDPGIFDAWSQGCGDGFRNYASGGIAGVIDLAGNDYSEAGNFSTGGGYYFGFGFHVDKGGDDQYVGSRYNQGFCAHQAVGVFLDMDGDDLYETRQGVAQGLAWDECATVFIDYAGDDRYEGGTGFSQGASAHNAICLFWDKGGSDEYIYAPGQARSGGNSYHGGTSLSLFIDAGGGSDFYSCEKSGNNLLTGWPEYGFFVDIPCSLDKALISEAWRKWWAAPEFGEEE